jgi:hypothetical protein
MISVIAFSMRRQLLHLLAALLTFTIGSTLWVMWKAPKLTDRELKFCTAVPSRCIDRELGRSLIAIDKKYKVRCWTPHPSVEDEKRLAPCYEEWQKARLAAME